MYKRKYGKKNYRRGYASKAAMYKQPTPFAEKKVLDHNIAIDFFGSDVASAGISALNLVRIGSTMNNRIGRKIRMSSLRIDGALSINATANNFRTTERIRMMIVYDRQTNGALPTLQDLLQCIEQDGTQSTSIFCGINLNNRDRFLVLWDQKWILPALSDNDITGVQSGFPCTMDNWQTDIYRKIKGLETLYKADSSPAVIGDISSGSLILFRINQNLGDKHDNGTHWKWTGNIRLRFTDS